LQKRPERRYSSVERLSGDIERFLEGRPIEARGASVGYRAAKFIARHRTAVAAACLVALLLLTGIAVAGWQARQTARARDRAEAEAVKARRVSAFLQQMLASPDPGWYTTGRTKGPQVPVRQVLDELGPRIDREFEAYPDVRAELHLAVGKTYRALGGYRISEEHLREAVQAATALLGEGHPTAIESRYHLAAALNRQGRTEEVAHVYEETLDIIRRHDPENRLYGYTLSDYAGVLLRVGQTERAEQYYRLAMEGFRARFGERHPATAGAIERPRRDLRGARPPDDGQGAPACVGRAAPPARAPDLGSRLGRARPRTP
jgi:serine/threonine-protein kinase